MRAHYEPEERPSNQHNQTHVFMIGLVKFSSCDAMKRGVGSVWPFYLNFTSEVFIQQKQKHNLALSSIHTLSIPKLIPSLSRSTSSSRARHPLGIQGTATTDPTERMGMMDEHNNNNNHCDTRKQDHHHHRRRQYQLLLTKQDEQEEKEEESAGASASASASVAASSSSSSGVSKKESIRVKFKPEVGKLQQLVNAHSSSSGDGWDKSWVQGLTPWDLGRPTPLLLYLLRTHSLPTGRALVPGCGSGHDVVAMACPDRFVVGLDISNNAIRIAKQLSSSSTNANCFTFLEADFFSWHPLELFDLVFDYTFFCALEPELRPAWARKIQDVLKHDGELITLMFPIDDHDGGPPYKVSVSDYEEVLHPIGFKAVSISDNELAVKARKGREKLGRWKRCPRQSLL